MRVFFCEKCHKICLLDNYVLRCAARKHFNLLILESVCNCWFSSDVLLAKEENPNGHHRWIWSDKLRIWGPHEALVWAEDHGSPGGSSSTRSWRLCACPQSEKWHATFNTNVSYLTFTHGTVHEVRDLFSSGDKSVYPHVILRMIF